MLSRWLSEEEERAWRAYRRMFTMLEARLARELAETGLSAADYTVLSDLVEVPDRRWRVTDLAEYMAWSQSRLSHHLARMERRGLVRREKDPDDARSAHVSLTQQGLRAIAAASDRHLSGVRQHMVDLLTADQLAALTEISETVLEHLGEPPPREPRSGQSSGS
ncbi:MarR family winged helix-turn-helix transcriptional regulator [Intrasporangium sp.]|uniref:MarR family winged helix-turn-helix transcriptional regulator n=1 Tax=Intrasporangium sp. TaxID=1925024 RepID=UPI00293B5ABE|nr:MarR family transcriptional regulator [Intrasporangium sp.]MDV3222691.1 MarR family transcriptional regulator [Intrasporangium sp.]